MSDKDFLVAVESMLGKNSARARAMARKTVESFDPGSYETLNTFNSNFNDEDVSKLDIRMFKGGSLLRAEFQEDEKQEIAWFVIEEVEGASFIFFVKPIATNSHDWSKNSKKFTLEIPESDAKVSRVTDVVTTFANINNTKTSKVDVVSQGLKGKKGRDLWRIPSVTFDPIPQEKTNDR